MRWLTWLGWVAVVVSVGILLVFGVHRIATIFRAPNRDDLFGIRYVRHPFVAVLHILPGVFFLTLAPLQFVPRIRNRHLAYHRAAGRVLVLCGVISGVFAIVAAFRFPAFGARSPRPRRSCSARSSWCHSAKPSTTFGESDSRSIANG